MLLAPGATGWLNAGSVAGKYQGGKDQAQHMEEEGKVGLSVCWGIHWGLGRLLTDPPGLFSRSDKTLQDIVYKLVPGLFKGVPVLPLLVPNFPFPGLGSSLLTLLRSCR